MAGRRASIGASQIEHPAKLQRLQGQGHQGGGAAKGIEIQEAETPLLHQAVREQMLRGAGAQLQAAALSLQRLQVALEQRQPVRIGVIGPDLRRTPLQPVAQGADAAARHQIEHAQGLIRRQMPHQQHAQVARGA